MSVTARDTGRGCGCKRYMNSEKRTGGQPVRIYVALSFYHSGLQRQTANNTLTFIIITLYKCHYIYLSPLKTEIRAKGWRGELTADR